MHKNERRWELVENCEAIGSVDRELREVSKLNNSSTPEDILTLTVGCSELLTIICC